MAHLVVGLSQKGGEGVEKAVSGNGISIFSPYYCIFRDGEELDKMDEDSLISEGSGYST